MTISFRFWHLLACFRIPCKHAITCQQLCRHRFGSSSMLACYGMFIGYSNPLSTSNYRNTCLAGRHLPPTPITREPIATYLTPEKSTRLSPPPNIRLRLSFYANSGTSRRSFYAVVGTSRRSFSANSGTSRRSFYAVVGTDRRPFYAVFGTSKRSFYAV